MRKAVTALFAATTLLGGINAHARAPLLRYGLEWGIKPTFLQSWHHNYISSEGYRVDDNCSEFTLSRNGLILANFGVNLTERFSLSLYGGYAGESKDNRIFPLMVRASLYPRGITADGPFCFAGSGAGFHAARPSAPDLPAAVLADAGGGYHLALSRSICLDLHISLKVSFDHDRINDADTGKWVPDADIRRNGSRAYALCLSVGLNF